MNTSKELEDQKQDALRWQQLLRDRQTAEWTTALHAYVTAEALEEAADNAIKGNKYAN